jgi:hypothetical protein
MKRIVLILILGLSTLTILMVLRSTFNRSGSFGLAFSSKVKSEFANQTISDEEILNESDIAHLPAPVKKYVIHTGAVGKSKPRNVRIAFEAEMFRKPGAKPMNASSEQYNFYEDYTRLFLMKASKLLIPFHAFHTYRNQEATFKVRVANLIDIVDVKGEDLTTAETVTLLNDMCIFVPGNLYDKRLSWKEIDSLSSQVTIENGKYKVSAILYFNEKGELINFISDDRYALQDDGTMKKARWSTPVKDYKEIDGRRIPTYGETIWNYPEGDFTYGTFRLKNIAYNVTGQEYVKDFR